VERIKSAAPTTHSIAQEMSPSCGKRLSLPTEDGFNRLSSALRARDKRFRLRPFQVVTGRDWKGRQLPERPPVGGRTCPKSSTGIWRGRSRSIP
jgi:hypothetical protein